jgi:hypothetical protein
VRGMSSRHLPGLDDLPDDPTNCMIEVTVAIGDAQSEGADNFNLYFVTPKWLAEQGDQPLVPEYMIVLNTFIWTAVETAVQRLIKAVPAADWDEFTAEFGRYAYWEFSHRRARF